MGKQMGDTNKWKNSLHNFLAIFSYVMVFFYLSLSLILLFTNTFIYILTPIQRYSIGGMLLVYSIFRAYRIFISQKEAKNDDE
ncbi:MAG: hypothetical protein ACOYOV_02435 [Bacteroidales bacterium]